MVVYRFTIPFATSLVICAAHCGGHAGSGRLFHAVNTVLVQHLNITVVHQKQKFQ